MTVYAEATISDYIFDVSDQESGNPIDGAKVEVKEGEEVLYEGITDENGEVSFVVEEEPEYVPGLYGTFWALLPPIIAIVLALLTKEVYSSLFIGILVGGFFYAGADPVLAIEHILEDGVVGSLSDGWNVGILVFLVILGMMVCLMNKAGGSQAFGDFAAKHIKSKVGAQLATVLLGAMIFIDDYFNCLTVGSVMKPVTDKHKVSREKLAYLIDATAAPICIIAPISSWAAAVTGFVEGEDGFQLFVKAIPYNFYAILTVIMVIAMIVMKTEFGPMKKYEDAMLLPMENKAETADKKNGKVIDLVLPIILLIICCIVGMIYTGGFFDGVSFKQAFADCDASVGLVLGSFVALMLTLLFYLIRRVLNLKECMECLPEGFKAMVPAILILTFAWTLKAMTDSLGAGVYVEGLVKGSAEGLMSFLPAVVFLVACILAFATGTSWGTFGILIPIVVDVFGSTDPTLMIISISACMAGAVCGDHCSPISDTTIMASAGAQCDHVKHVSTQLPYAIFVAVISFITYIVAGFTKSAWISLPFGIIAVFLGLLLMKNVKPMKKEA
ncbi:MAG: Na+/H+ antiporter NhaC family protein [Lachnospiraceae bacterium]|nr:Na+/H+ antiporter NhaC family protein [Lachnospiraceae bacterium]